MNRPLMTVLVNLKPSTIASARAAARRSAISGSVDSVTLTSLSASTPSTAGVAARAA
jgi:hypothetical protein